MITPGVELYAADEDGSKVPCEKNGSVVPLFSGERQVVKVTCAAPWGVDGTRVQVFVSDQEPTVYVFS